MYTITLSNGKFLSTSSARRTTATKRSLLSTACHFYPRPPRGGRPRRAGGRRIDLRISIHVLREEDDAGPARITRSIEVFLSTSSARRTTAAAGFGHRGQDISIHVLREEDDYTSCITGLQRNNFYPRPPRGGRLYRDAAAVGAKRISIHVLREEDDMFSMLQRI